MDLSLAFAMLDVFTYLLARCRFATFGDICVLRASPRGVALHCTDVVTVNKETQRRVEALHVR